MRALLALMLLLTGASVQAAQLPVVNGVGATVQMNMVQNGSGAYSNRNTVCDGTNPDLCAPVDTVKGLSVNVTGLIGQGTITSGQSGLIGMGAVTTAAPTYTTAQSSPLSLDTNGNLRTITLGNFASSADAIGTNPGLSGILSFNYAFNGTSWDRLQVDGSKNLKINCLAGCSAGTASNAFDGNVTSASNGQTNAWLYGYNGTTWDRLRDDGSFNLKVNCAVGCTGGSLSNASDAVVTSSTNGGVIGFGYAFNGTTWDRLRDDGSFNLKVNLATAIPAGANVIGHIISDAGSTVQLGTGANIVGRVTTDQTTPGTTDLVHASPTVPLSNASDAVATTATNTGTEAFNYAFNGTTWDRLQADGSKNLKVNCTAGCTAGTASNAADAQATSTANGQTDAWLFGFNGTTWDRLRVDGSKNLDINCVVGCSGGTSSNATSAVATSSTNGNQLAFGYAFNGATWDQLQDDASKNLKITVNTSLPTGANVIGHVITDSGSIINLPTGASTSANQTTEITSLTTIASNTGAPIPAGTNAIGSVSQTNGDPCSSVAHASTPINISSATTTKIVAGTAAKKTYICHVFMMASAAENVALVEGSGTNCATSPLGMMGGNTAATGQNLAANTGFVEGVGDNFVAHATVNANDVCLITSSAAQLSGTMVTVQN